MNLVFLDTNVLLYAAGGRLNEPEKHEIAIRILRESKPSVSTQVIGEFYQNVRRKFAKEVPLARAREWVDSLESLACTDVDMALIRSAMFIAERFKIAFWDAALIAASERLGAAVLYTEDLSHRQKYGSVTVVNPFRAN